MIVRKQMVTNRVKSRWGEKQLFLREKRLIDVVEPRKMRTIHLPACINIAATTTNLWPPIHTRFSEQI